MTTQGQLTWLHISDAHIGDKRHAFDADHILSSLRRDLSDLSASRSLHPDLLFFTGDAAYGELPDSRLKDQYGEVERFLSGVRNAFDPPIPKERVFIVPGNHDVNRSQATEEQDLWFEHAKRNGDPSIKVDQLVRDGQRQFLRYMERLTEYSEFLAASGYDHLLLDRKRLVFAQELEIGGLRLGIAGLNTAWSCCERTKKGDVWLGRWQLTSLRNRLQECSLRIALSHHPFNWLTEHEDPVLGQELGRLFHFHLHGHEHSDWVTSEAHHTRIAAGACFDHSQKDNGYNFVRIDLASGRGEIHLRRYDRRGGGWVASPVHSRTDDAGIWRVSVDRAALLRAHEPPPVSEEETTATPPHPLGARVDAFQFFSPAHEIDDARKFVGRRAELERAVRALRSRGASIAIFGHAGLGKTSLALQLGHVAAGASPALVETLELTQLIPADGFAHPVIYYSCQRRDATLAHVLAAVLRDASPPFSTRALLNDPRVKAALDRTENAVLKEQLSAILMSAAAGPGAEPSVDVRSVFASFAHVVCSTAGTELVVLLDEINVIGDRSGLAAMLKELHYVKFVLIGSAVDVRLLVQDHASVPRQLTEGQVRVREMTAVDLRAIIAGEVRRGTGRFEFAEPATRTIVEVASGMPYFVHLLGRYALEAAARTEQHEHLPIFVTYGHVQQALQNCSENMADLDESYIELTEASWQREFVLKLLAHRAESDISVGNLSQIAKAQGVKNLSAQIEFFVRKQVLEQTHANMVRFRDPRLKVFARLREARDDGNRRRLSFLRENAQQPAGIAPGWMFDRGSDAPPTLRHWGTAPAGDRHAVMTAEARLGITRRRKPLSKA